MILCRNSTKPVFAESPTECNSAETSKTETHTAINAVMQKTQIQHKHTHKN
jgi:hypothetical protein